MVPPEGRAKMYILVPGWWIKYKPWLALLVLKSPLLAYVSRVSLKESSGWKSLYRGALTDHCVMGLTVCVHRVHPENDIT